MNAQKRAISAQEFKSALGVAGERVRTARQELCMLDAAAGDGDLGTTLDLGFSQVRAVLEDTDADDIGALLGTAGTELARKAPSTIGTLLAASFQKAGRELDGVTELPPPGAVRFFRATASGVAERGRADVGERTVLDAMVAAADAAAASSDAGDDAVEVFRAAALGARAGADATAAMEPVHGRASWVRERARGMHDAGAVAWALYVEGLANSFDARS